MLKRLFVLSLCLVMLLALLVRTAAQAQQVSAQLAETIPLLGVDKVHQRYGLSGDGVGVYIIDYFDQANPNDHGWVVKQLIQAIAPGVSVWHCNLHFYEAFKGRSNCMDQLFNNRDLMRKIDLVNASFTSGSMTNSGSQACDAHNVLGTDEAERMLEFIEEKLIVAAVGNNDSPHSILFPACLEGVLSVGATVDTGEQIDEVANFSNRPSFMDVVAPGAPNVILPSGTNFWGTSASTPIVTAISALLLEASHQLSPSQIRNIFIETGDPAYDPIKRVYYPRVNAYKAAQVVLGASNTQSGVDPDIEIISSRLSRTEMVQGEELCVEIELFNHGGAGSVPIEILDDGASQIAVDRPIIANQREVLRECFFIYLPGSHTIELSAYPRNRVVGVVTVVRDLPRSAPGYSVPESTGSLLIFDDNKNARIDDNEFFRAVDMWIALEVRDELFFDLIDAWIGAVALQHLDRTRTQHSYAVHDLMGNLISHGGCSSRSVLVAQNSLSLERVPNGVYVLTETDCETGRQRVRFLSIAK